MIKLSSKRCKNDEKNIIELAQSLSLRRETVEILYSRGIRDAAQITKFLNPSRKNFIDPFLLSGMREAVDRILEAKERGETVVVYGDYDVDGVSATTIMTKALTELGLNVAPFIPERADGYGLSVENIDKIFEELFPDLIVTVDCGISGEKEVEYIKDLGADVIVTDHHELPEILPDCITVNCKIPSEYGFTSLCGAGVAYKLAYALLGEKANSYLDLVALATIADSMPLLGENRDLVYEGVNCVKSGKACAAIKELISVASVKDITASALAFSLAPRINAAGRMGNARLALQLFLSPDLSEVKALAQKLNEFNVARQRECELLYKSARDKVVKEEIDKKIIVLEDDEWNGGLVGIIAARLVEEFSRPVILFSQNEGKLHGSARSVEAVNIYEAIAACKEPLKEFGGHAQAAGITVEKADYPAFKALIEAYFEKNYSVEDLRVEKTADCELKERATLALARELERLEPCGVGNKKPLFLLSVENASASPLKQGSPHVSIKTDYVEATYFSAASKLDLLNSAIKKKLLVELAVSYFNGREYLRAYVKDAEYEITEGEALALEAFSESLKTALNPACSFDSASNVAKIAEQKAEESGYGAVFAFYNPFNVKKYEFLASLPASLYLITERTLRNNVAVAPRSTQIGGFKSIVYLDRPLGFPLLDEGFNERFLSDEYAYDYSRLSTDKIVFAEVFKVLREREGKTYYSSVALALSGGFNKKMMQVVFCVEVFLELGFLSLSGGVLRLSRGVKRSLDESLIYKAVVGLKG